MEEFASLDTRKNAGARCARDQGYKVFRESETVLRGDGLGRLPGQLRAACLSLLRAQRPQERSRKRVDNTATIAAAAADASRIWRRDYAARVSLRVQDRLLAGHVHLLLGDIDLQRR